MLLPRRRHGRRLGELEHLADLQSMRVLADRLLVELVDLVRLIGSAVELDRDLVQAYKWASLANDTRLVDSLKRRMTKQQLEEAEKLVGEGN